MSRSEGQSLQGSSQPGWPQLQEISSVSLASSQEVLQYFFPSGTGQIQAGCAHFLVSSAIRILSFSAKGAVPRRQKKREHAFLAARTRPVLRVFLKTHYSTLNAEDNYFRATITREG
jgi:hypothetical protein